MPKTDAALAQVLTDLSQKLGVTVEHLWAVLVKQAFISGISDLFIYTLLTVIAVIWYRGINKLSKRTKKSDKSYSDIQMEEGIWALFIVSGAILLVSSICSICSFGATLGKFLNPEFWALKQIWK